MESNWCKVEEKVVIHGAKNKVSVSLNEADLRKIKEFSEKNGLSVSAGIRVLLLRGIKQQEARKECLL